MSVTPPKRFFIRTILLFVMFVAYGVPKVYAQCTDQCPVIAGVNINSCVGVITINVTGNGPFTFDWRDSGGTQVSTSFIASGLTADNYTVTVTDVDGDTETATYTVTNPPNLVGSVVVNDVTCRGDSDAQVIVTMGNGNPDYEWELFNGVGTSIGTGTAPPFSNIITLGGLGVDNYTLTVTDDNGCTGDITFSITEPADFLGYSIGASSDATCFNSADGTLSATGTGGWGDYVYQWERVSDGAVVGTTATVTGLAPGDYRLVITDRNGTGCTITTPNQTIGSPPEIIPSANISDASCNGASDGSIDLSVSGGVGPYTYSWSNGATSQDISGLTAGSYTVTVTDNAGCTDMSTYTVGEPAVLTINPTVTDVACFGEATGVIESNVSGGTAPYNYVWSSGATSADISSLSAGTYDLTVTDDNGCSTTLNNIIVGEPAAALSKQSDSQTNPSCAGYNDGSVTITMQGGTGPYSYSWSNGDNTATASNLTAGMHTVTVTDNNGCIYNETFTLTDPPSIAVTPALTEPTCNGAADGEITVSASNGTAPYVYNWNTGDSGPTINGLVAGTYTVTVTDQNGAGCSVVETITLGQPAVLNDNATVNDISCNGANDGSISLAVTGGTGPYTYSWSNGASTNNISGLSAGPYSVTIEDDNGCSIIRNFTIVDPPAIGVSHTQVDILCKGALTGEIDITPSGGTAPYTYAWSNGSTAQDLVNVAAGSYTVTVTDDEGCTVNLTVTLTEPATVMTLSGTETDGTCAGSNNGSIDLTVTGGTGPYTYLWNTGATSEDINGLAPGIYSVSVEDAGGCIKSIDFTISEPSPISVSETLTNVTCNGDADGTISLSVGGGTGPYSYSWADDGSITTKDRTGLGPGNYTITVEDASGCLYVESFNITEPAILSSTATQLNVSCFGESTGSINLSISGGTTPYTFLWSNGALTEDLNNIPAGNYSVTITDAKGCTDNKSFTITEPASALAVTSSVSQITCNGAADGVINLTVSGGSAPYSFNWAHGSTAEDLSNLSAGNYSVTVTDNNGCTFTDSFVITDPPVLTLSEVVTDIDCNGAANGEIDITVGGGEAPYTFAWSNGETTEDVSGLIPGNYSVTVTDARGCTINDSYTISQPTALAFSYTSGNVSCFGLSDGSIDITVSGGTAPYSYSWSNTEITEDIGGLAAGDYTVTVTDFNGCTLVETITITQPIAPLSVVGTPADISCFGGSDGSIQLTPSGGTAPYTYSWSTGATTKDISGLVDGTYQVTITDDNGCTVMETYTINMPTAMLASGTQTNILCNGDATGAIDLTVSGGTTPYTYTWSNGANTQDLSNIVAGNYQVTIEDASGCSLVRNFTITQPLALLVGENIQDVSCFGDADGFIDLSVSGGIAPYSYSWSNGATTQDLFNLSGGNYSVTITDGNGCTTIKNYSITEPASALSVSGSVTDESCFGDNQGAISLTVGGGTAPYTYNWNHGPTNKDVAGLGRGAYQVTVTDNNGCSVTSNFTVGGPDQIQLAAVATQVDCNGAANGELDVTVTGGTGPYTYLWNNAETTEDLSNLSPGTYTLTVTDANGCSRSNSWTITQPLSISVGQVITDVDCFGASNGAIDITVSGGIAPYSYNWSNGATSQDVSGLSGGNYSVIITDANGCTRTANYTVGEPAAALAVLGNVTDEQCFGDAQGAVSLTVSGGTGPYSYAWDHGPTSKDISGLGQGTYQVTVTDANGCFEVSSFTVNGPSQLQLTAVSTQIDCNGAANGQINATLSGGTGPYTYSWNNGQTTEDITGLSPGNYSLTVSDANGCSVSGTWTITQPLAISAGENITNVNCFGAANGAIDITVSGGIAPYSYNWSTGATSQDISGLSGGNYSVTITDANGCTSVRNYTVSEPAAPLSVVGVITDELCFGDGQGSISLTVSGGTGPYSYSWDHGPTSKDVSNLVKGTYQVTVTDANGCFEVSSFTIGSPDQLQISGVSTQINCNGAANGAIDATVTGGTGPYTYLWNNGVTSEDVSGLTPGNYSLTVTDANGCTRSASWTITQPLVVSVSRTITDVTCFGASNGAIDVTVSGGISPYTYSWSNGATTQDISGVSGGTYSVTITDANGCSSLKTYVVSEPTAALSVSGTITDEVCFGDNQGAIGLTVAGGTAPYSYNWSNGASTKDISALGQGNYEVEITDANGCSVTSAFVVSGPSVLEATGSVTNITCNNADNGSIDVEVSGGTLPYNFAWNHGETSEDLTNLSPGNYSVVITDANGCSISRSYIVTQPAALAIAKSVTNVNCFGAGNGAISVTVTGGTLPYTYSWSNGASTRNISSLNGGSYDLTVTDGNGCILTQTIVVAEPAAALSLSALVSDEECFGDNQGGIDLTVTGGTAPYTYSWNNGSSSQDILGLERGAYQVTVTDKNGCSVTETYTVSGPDLLTVSGVRSPISCNGADDGELDITVTGGTGPYTYSWNHGETTEDISGLSPGTYVLTVTDANGCIAGANWTLNEPLPLTINHVKNDVSCFGADDGTISLTVSGGTLPYSYSWSNGSTSKDLSSLAGGTYEVTVTDARGCQQIAQILVNAPTAALSATSTIKDAFCNGLPTGEIQLAVSGGTTPYNYAWSNGSNQRDLKNVFAGNYSVTITDAKGCTFIENYTIGEPDVLDVSFEVTNSSCLGDTDGAVSVTPNGGTAPFSYVWSNGSTSKDLANIAGGTYNLTITDANGCSITRSVEVGDSKDLNVEIQKFDVLCKGESAGQIYLDITGGSGEYDISWSNGETSPDLYDIPAGVYSATITDSNNCGTSITVVISEPSEALSVQLTDYNDLLCFGDNSGFMKANPRGGVAPYTYLWSNGARTNQISSLKAGNYTVTVTDANGCIVQAQATIGQPAKPITISSQGKFNLDCKGDNDGRIVIDVEGGTGLYEFVWSTGATTSSINNLGVGDYTVRVKDENGCIQERVFSIKEPEELAIADALVNESQCYDDRNGSIELNIEGGVEPYSYQWSTGATTKNLIGITSGVYSVLITDANGCQVQGNYTLDEPALFRMEPEMTEISCIGANDASISLNIEGGIEPVAIRWSTGASSETITGLGPGEYNVLVSDDKGCTIQQTFNIVEPLDLTLDAYIEDATRCNDPRSGRVNVIVSGGSEPYTYRWSNGATTSEITDVLPGTYVVRVRDKYNCEVQGTYTVLQPEPLQIGLSTEPYIDCDNRIAGMLVKADVKGGVGNYKYQWSKGNSNTNQVLLTEAGRLTLEVLDDRGCFQRNSISVDVPELGLADFEYEAESIDRTGDLASNDPVSFFDLSVGEVIDWHWDFGDGFDSNEVDPIHTYDAPGTYTVRLVVTDRTGCQTEKISVLEITEGYRVIIPNAFTPNGDGNNDFFRPRMLGLTKAQLIIYNTWGEVIFSTDDIESKGWDGTINGRKAENGNYVYKIIGLSFNGLKVEREGIFALIN